MTLANRYVLDGVVAGELDTTSFTGHPVIALTFEGVEVTDATLSATSFGQEVTAALPGQPERTATQLRLILPRVEIGGGQTGFAGIAVVATSASGLTGGPTGDGVIDNYTVYPVSGLASVVDF